MKELYFLNGDLTGGVLTDKVEAMRVFNEAREKLIAVAKEDATIELETVESNRVVYNFLAKDGETVLANGGIAMMIVKMAEDFSLEPGTVFYANDISIDSSEGLAFKTREKAEKAAFMSFASKVAMIDRPKFLKTITGQKVIDLDTDKVYYLSSTGEYKISEGGFVLETHVTRSSN